MNRKQYIIASIGIIVLGFFFGGLVYPDFFNKKIDSFSEKTGLNIPRFSNIPFKLGLDLQGGTQLTYQADLRDVGESEREQRMNGLRDLIERRIDLFGIAEPLVQVKDDRLIVELAGVADPLEAVEMIGETPFLEFKELMEEQDVAPEVYEMIESYNDESRLKAEEILSKVLGSSDFSELAIEFSDDPGSGAQGGDLGWFPKGIMVKEFEDAVFSLREGEIYPEVVETSFGYHIILKTGDENESGEIRASHILLQKLSVYDFVSDWKRTELGGEHLRTASLSFDSVTGGIVIELEFTSEGARIFEQITDRNIGHPLAIFLDGKSIIDTTGDGRITDEDLYAPIVQGKITGGRAIITGESNMERARQIVSRLRSGALPVPIELVSQQNVGPALGMDSLSRSLNAGIIGFIMVAIFMVAFYRLPGLLASLSLALYIIFALFIFKIIPVTLTLSGIAGFILSVGMAIDANILIFSRMREEISSGNTLSGSIKNGFKRAWPSIRDGNLTTLIVAFILFFIGTSFVKGFALTLILGIMISLFCALIITKCLLKAFIFEKKE